MKLSWNHIVLLLSFVYISNTSLAESVHAEAYSFSSKYAAETLLEDSEARNAFIQEFLYWESKFHQPGIAFDENLGTTFDGHAIDFDSGELLGGPRKWSAASKEAIHIEILTLVLQGSERAQYYVSPDNPGHAEKIAKEILRKKIQTFEDFLQNYPGYGGYLPWYLNEVDGIHPTHNWRDRVPALDNGEFVWAVFGAIYALEDAGEQELADRYRVYFEALKKNAAVIFYDEEMKKIRAEASIKDNLLDPFDPDQFYQNNIEGYFLDDPYEGELFAVFLTAFAKEAGLSEEKVEALWKDKKLVQKVYESPEGALTVRQGHWFSSHEEWNRLQLPYIEVPEAAQIIENGEKVRTWHSYSQKTPGLFASTHDVVYEHDSSGYVSDLGVQAVAKEKVKRHDIVVPYASFPLILASETYGAIWLDHMLDGPKMQGPYGVSESISIRGDRMAPVLTWDGKCLIVLAFAVSEMVNKNGEHPKSEYLKREGLYQGFVDRIGTEYRAMLEGDVLGQDVPYAIPSKIIPQVMPDFEFNDGNVEGELEFIDSKKYQGEGALSKNYKLTDEWLLLPSSNGFIWKQVSATEVTEESFVIFEILTSGGLLGFELKNKQDETVSSEKIQVFFPDTREQWARYLVSLKGLVPEDSEAAAVVFSDPQADMYLRSVKLITEKDEQCEVLTWDGYVFCKIPEKEEVWNYPFENLARALSFQVGGEMAFKQHRFLEIGTSPGWAWADAGQAEASVDLGEQNHFVALAESPEGAKIFLELKNKKDEFLLRGERKKVSLNIPASDSPVPIVFDLKDAVADISDLNVKIISLSDAEGDLKIYGFGFTSNFSDQAILGNVDL